MGGPSRRSNTYVNPQSARHSTEERRPPRPHHNLAEDRPPPPHMMMAEPRQPSTYTHSKPSTSRLSAPEFPAPIELIHSRSHLMLTQPRSTPSQSRSFDEGSAWPVTSAPHS